MIFENLSFRLIDSQDKVEDINTLLRAAYSKLAAAGMRYAATHEDVESTRKNISQGECHLAFINLKLVGCCLLRKPGSNSGPLWYSKKEVATFGRFAIDPLYQGQGLGSKFLSYIENRARELQAKELALDTSEKALHLIQMYEKRGYRFIEFHQWEITNYRSVVMSKIL